MENIAMPTFSAKFLPKACGFNLLEKFQSSPEFPRGRKFQEWDFDFMAQHGFTFARLPMDYRVWTRDLDGPRRDIDETVLEDVAAAVRMGQQRGIHVCLNIHRAPGYCINQPELEPYNLWTDAAARENFAWHWGQIARYFRDFPNDACSFDLLNEPPSYNDRGFTPASHRLVMGLACAAIREHAPQRLIICDGANVGNTPAAELTDLGVAQSTRGYAPWQVTHYKASWMGKGESYVWDEPTWPFREGEKLWNADQFRRHFQPWADLARGGVGVHMGEFGVYDRTPAAATYAFLDDLLTVTDERGWGWALWNLRGSFGPLDNQRADAATEEYQGHRLDRHMLEILKRHR